MTKNLYLFVDTNLFIQCRGLYELDWSEWEDFSEVHLIVCLPVQREIDKQKIRGNNRVGRRARDTYSSLFRAIATGEKEYELIKEVQPQVKLFLESPSRPDPELASSLDYGRPDDEIIGCLHRFAKDHPDFYVRLLTHDTGPMMTARGLGLSVSPIRNEWVLPPENNDEEREVARLRQEVAQLKKAEPQFDIKCIDAGGAETDVCELIYRIYRPLTEDDVSHCMNLIEHRFPIETEFNRHDLTVRPHVAMPLLGRQPHYEPASEEAIRNYRENEYPEWIDDCREWLTSVHEKLQLEEGLPFFRFEVTNVGARPGKDALVVIRARGDFKICPPPFEEDEPEETEETDLRIPSPPRPPRGRWRSSNTSLSRMLGGFNYLGGSPLVDLHSLTVPAYIPPTPRRDPNLFYYKPTRITEPAHTFSLECKQWCHETSSEPFAGDIFVAEGVTKASGALECEIHAENLFKPTFKRIPVRIELEYPSSRDVVEKLIDPPFDQVFRV